MIIGIGIDSVEIDRFVNFHSFFSRTSLSKIFHSYEIDYCLHVEKKIAERFAVRFAVKEAFLKAISHCWNQKKELSLFNICKNVSIINAQSGMPELVVEWNNLLPFLTIQTVPLKAHISLTHCTSIATAYVILEKIS